MGTVWEKGGKLKESESSPFHARAAEARDVCRRCVLPVVASGCVRRAVEAVFPSIQSLPVTLWEPDWFPKLSMAVFKHQWSPPSGAVMSLHRSDN